MCGIAGILGSPDRQAVERIAAAMETRGPDDVGFYEDRWLSLGHRRLSILDLSEAGHQPMSRAGGKRWIVCNGEIYNFKDLRRELEGRGHLFRSRSAALTRLRTDAGLRERVVRNALAAARGFEGSRGAATFRATLDEVVDGFERAARTCE